MIQTRNRNVVFGPQLQIETVISRYGAWKVLTAALVALLNGRRRRPPPANAKDLPDYLREDVGLPVAQAPRTHLDYL